MDNPYLVRVLYRLTDFYKQVKPFLDGEIDLIAEFCDR